MGDSNPRGCYPNTLSKCLNGGCEVFARVRFRRSARCANDSHDAWIGLDREELLPELLPPRWLGGGPTTPGLRTPRGEARPGRRGKCRTHAGSVSRIRPVPT